LRAAHANIGHFVNYRSINSSNADKQQTATKIRLCNTWVQVINNY